MSYTGKVIAMSTEFKDKGKDSRHTILIEVELTRSRSRASALKKEERIKEELYKKTVSLFVT